MDPQNDAIFEAGDTCSKKTVIFGIYVKFREGKESEKRSAQQRGTSSTDFMPSSISISYKYQMGISWD